MRGPNASPPKAAPQPPLKTNAREAPPSLAAPATAASRNAPMPRARRRDLILAAARAEFAASGFNEARIADIAKMSGASSRTMYDVFASKTDLFLAVLRESAAGVEARLSETESPAQPARDRLAAFGVELARACNDPELIGLARVVIAEHAKLTPPIVAEINALWDQLTRTLEAMMQACLDGPAVETQRRAARFLGDLEHKILMPNLFLARAAENPDAIAHAALEDAMRDASAAA